MSRNPITGRLAPAIAVVAWAACALCAGPVDVTVRGGAKAWKDALVSVALPDGFTAERVRAVDRESGADVPCQLLDGGKAALLRLDLAASRTRRIRIREAPMSDEGPYSVKRAEGRLDLLRGGDLLLSIRLTGRRAPCVYPLNGPGGVSMTRDYPFKDTPGDPRDHPHHISMWFAHGDVNGADFWQGPVEEARIVNRKVLATEGGPLLARAVIENEWIGPDGEPLLTEQWDVRAYEQGGVRFVDFATSLIATHKTLRFGDTKEGTFGIRVRPSMQGDRGGKIVNSEGVTGADAWGKSANWCHYTGPIEGKTMGIGVCANPRNLGGTVRWHVREYGLFAANPFGREAFGMTPESYSIGQGSQRTFEYLVVLHEGGQDAVDMARIYEEFTNPPEVVVSPEGP